MLVPSSNSKSHILYIPTIPREPTHYHFGRMFTVLEEVNQIPPSCLDIEFDFQRCTFLNHSGVAFFGGLASLIKFRGGRVRLNEESLPKALYMNLAQNGFLYDLGLEHQPWNGNSIPYWSDRQHNSTAIGDYLRNKWLGKGWVKVSPNLQEHITGEVSEIYQNAFDHSQSEIGIFSCGQHYPNARWLQLTVVDFGVGIPNSVRSLPNNSTMSTTEALTWAFVPGNTTKQGVCSGMGLSFINKFVIKNKGKLAIFSNDGYVTIDDNGTRYQNKCTNFSGTLVNIDLQCNEAYYCLSSEVTDSKGPWF